MTAVLRMPPTVRVRPNPFRDVAKDKSFRADGQQASPGALSGMPVYTGVTPL